MPAKNLKYTFDYITKNLTGFIVILILIFTMDILNNNRSTLPENYAILTFIINFFILLITQGYGLVITRDIIANGNKLPKIKFKESLKFGIKLLLISSLYSTIQIMILGYISTTLSFPSFEIEEAILNFGETLRLFYTHNPIHTVIFIVISAVIAYSSTFFMEIALARLAEGGSLKDAVNIIKIKQCIDIIGWRHYAVDYTKIILTIGILTYLKYGIHLSPLPNHAFDLIIGLVIFIVQFIGIGMVYREYREKKREMEFHIKVNVQ